MSRTVLRSIPQVLAIGLIAWVTFLVVRSGLLPDAPRGAPAWLATCALLAAGGLALVAHELGHVIAGLLAGFDFGALYLGPVRLVRGARGVDVRLNRRLALWGGAAQMLPGSGGHARLRSAFLVSGGPAASLMLGGAALWGYLTLVDPLLAVGSLAPLPDALARALVGFGLTSLGVGLVTLVPGTTSGFPTDGAQLLAILRGADNVEWNEAIAEARLRSSRGEGPGSLPEALIATLLSAAETPDQRAHAYLLDYTRGLALGDESRAASRLDGALSLVPRLTPAVAAAVHAEAAYFSAAHRGDGPAARALLAAAGAHARALGEPRYRAEAAILLAEGNPDAALSPLRKAKAEALDRSDPGRASFIGALLDRLATLAPPPTR